MMEKIITLSGCIQKDEHIWKRRITNKFIITDPRQMGIYEMTAKHQLFRLIYDTSQDDEIKTGPYIATRCIDNVDMKVERFMVIGEPTFETLLEWIDEYGDECEYFKQLDDFHKENLKRRKRVLKRQGIEGTKNIDKLEERFYEVAFIWNDPE